MFAYELSKPMEAKFVSPMFKANYYETSYFTFYPVTKGVEGTEYRPTCFFQAVDDIPLRPSVDLPLHEGNYAVS